MTVTNSDQQGFPYPFLHSIKDGANLPPDGYDEKTTVQKLDSFESELIPDEARPNILVIQLESFSDFEAMGVNGIADYVYDPLRQLQKESSCGILVREHPLL